MKRISCIIGIIVIAFAFQSCNTGHRDWRKAIRKNTIEGYTKFLRKHPKSDLIKEAKNKIDSLTFVEKLYQDWAETLDSLSVKKLGLFLNNYPNSEYTKEGLRLMDSISLKEAIVSINIKNPKFDTLNYKNINTYYNILNNEEKQVLIGILAKRSDYFKDTSDFIATIKLAEGKDFSEILKPTDNYTISNFEVYFTILTQGLADNSTTSVIINGALLGESPENSLIFGNGDYLACGNLKKINLKGSYTVRRFMKSICFIFSTFYPNDKLYFVASSVGQFGEGEPLRLAFGKNTVIRIEGEVPNFFEGINIKSDETYPLHLILKDDGLYYLMGKGEINIENNKTLVFKSS